MERRVLLISNHNVDRRAWNGVVFEFIDVIAGLESATVVAPGAAPLVRVSSTLFEPMHRDRGSLRTVLRELQMVRRGAAIEPVTLTEDYDVCLFVGQFLSDLINLRRVKGWRRRSRHAVAFILESWRDSLDRSSSELALLDQFDQVFVLNASAIADIRRYIQTPTSFLASAADCRRACPSPVLPDRVIDIASIGRRIDPVHQTLLATAQRRGWFYCFDAWGDIKAIDWAQVRNSNADMLRRSRYAIAWDPSAEASKAAEMRDERVLTTRYFECAASGAVILGSAAECPEFAAAFDWPDAVVPIATDGSDLEARIDEIEADPGRRAAISRSNTVNCLRRHDWSHRWAQILASLGLEPTVAHLDRMAMLASRAATMEGAATDHSRMADPAPLDVAS